jgi:F-type H+-transporting ATPase subunit a
MPEHTSFFSYLIAMFPALGENMHNFGESFFGVPVGAHSAEPIATATFLVLLIIGLALVVRSKIAKIDESVIPDEHLSVRTFFELLIEYFYDMMKDMMGPKRAKRYFPIIGTCACFIFFGNAIGLIPGFTPPTSSWNITLACALVVFVSFNYYGIKENGLGYFKHLAGPMPAMAPLIFPLEVISLCIRPITLSIRLMLNMAVDHLLVTIAAGIFVFLLPIPIMILGTLIVIVQVMVFCLLSSIYIALATEHEEHDGHAAPAQRDGQEAAPAAHAH